MTRLIDCGLRVAGCGLQVADWRLWVAKLDMGIEDGETMGRGDLETGRLGELKTRILSLGVEEVFRIEGCSVKTIGQ